jgi:Tol biopolymer transport system component/cytosine/adenosine deaminase-related metal-dependent hydrolase
MTHKPTGKGGKLSRRAVLQAGGITLAALGTTGMPDRAVAAQERGQAPGATVDSDGKSQSTRRYVTVSEGTNIAAACSPDGRTIAFDLYGILWLLDIDGGSARRLTDDLSEIAQPDWSPDGRTLVFQSYRDGNFHVWSIGADGTGLQQHTTGRFDCREPRTAPDGRRVAFSSDRSGRYAIHILDLSSGECTPLADASAAASTAQEVEPAWAPDGKAIALVTDKIRVDIVDLQGRRTTVALLKPSADIFHPAEIHNPSWTPDGKSLLYTVIENGTARLVKCSTRPGPAQVLVENEDVFPFRAAWLPGGDFVYTSNGKIRRRSLATSASSTIEFSATVMVITPAYRKRKQDFDSPKIRPVKGIGSPVLSPDGGRIAFRALNDLWLMQIGMKPVPMFRDRFYKSDPDFSPDGGRLVYSSDRGGTLDLWIRDLHTGADEQLTHLPHAAVSARWSPDGKTIAFLDQTGTLHSVDVASGAVRKEYDALWEPGRPTWSPDGKFIAMAAFKPYSARYREGLSEILTIERATGHATYTPPLPERSLGTRGDDGPLWSPDGRYMAVAVESTLWILPVDANGRMTGAGRRLNDEVTDAPSWSGDSKTLLYLSNGRLRLIDIGGVPRNVSVPLTWSRARPGAYRDAGSETPIKAGQSYSGAVTPNRTIVRVNRLWDGMGPDYRHDVDVVIDGHRIADVLPTTATRPSDANARFIDATQLTMMPGLVDMHTHRQMQGYSYGDRQGRLWLAMGVTSTRSPGAPAYHMVEDREAIDAGLRIGPRHFATGEAIDGTRIFYNFMRPVTTERQMTLELERADALSYDMIKTYVRLAPERQQKVIEWAHAHGMHVSSHYHFPSFRFAADCMEHLGATNRLGYSRTVSALGAGYQDVTALFVQAQAGRTPTLFTSGALLGEDTSLVEDRRVKALYPGWEYARLLERAKQMSTGDRKPLLEQLERNVGQVKDMLRSGGRVLSGTDAPIDFLAISLHLNLRGMVKYGVTPYEALLTATRFAGEFLGEPLGVVTPGALADLVLIDGDPLLRIEDAAAVRQVIKHGEVMTVDELIGPFADKGSSPRVSSLHGLAVRSPKHVPQYWWHNAAYVESSRAACCADHAHQACTSRHADLPVRRTPGTFPI